MGELSLFWADYRIGNSPTIINIFPLPFLSPSLPRLPAHFLAHQVLILIHLFTLISDSYSVISGYNNDFIHKYVFRVFRRHIVKDERTREPEKIVWHF